MAVMLTYRKMSESKFANNLHSWKIAEKHMNGFTLVELLVVISIIAMLLSIIVPSLQAARERAKRIICANNLHQCHIGTVVYANENDNQLPSSYIYKSRGFYAPWMGYICYDQYGDVHNLGYLHKNKIIENPEVFYCPSQKAKKWTLEHYESRMPYGSSGSYRSNFIFNPNPNDYTKEPIKAQYDKIYDMPSHAILAMDLLLDFTSIPHVGSQGAAGWNILYAGGNIDFKHDQETNEYLLKGIFVGSDWRIFEECVDRLKR